MTQNVPILIQSFQYVISMLALQQLVFFSLSATASFWDFFPFLFISLQQLVYWDVQYATVIISQPSTFFSQPSTFFFFFFFWRGGGARGGRGGWGGRGWSDVS